MQEMDLLIDRIRALHTGRADISQPIPTDSLSPEGVAVVQELNQFLKRVQGALQVLDHAVGQMAVKEALNVLQLKRQTAVIDDQRQDTERLSVSVEELAQGVNSVAQEAAGAASATQRMAEVGGRSLDMIGRVLQAVEELKDQATTTQQSVRTLAETGQRASARLQSIRGIAQTSGMLAINAAIQAAHANSPAFAVVAQEMRKMADQTATLVKGVEEELKAMDVAAVASGKAMNTMAAAADETAREADQAVADLREIRMLISGTAGAVESIAAVSEEQAAGTEELAAATEDLAGKVASAASALAITRNMAVSDLAEQAHGVLGQFYIGSYSDQMRQYLEQVAGDLEQVVEGALTAGQVREQDLWETDYREVVGADIAALSRLFRVDRVPPTGFEPAKYMTRYDAAIDRQLNEVLDRYMEQGRVAFLTVLDMNAFALAQPRRARQDWTGIPDQDLTGNRIKRFFADPHSVKSARVALPDSLLKRERISRNDLSSLGLLTADRPASRPFLLQAYARDTGEVVMDLSMPLYVRGKRWAAVRTGYQTRN